MDKSTHIPFGKEYTATPITVAEMVKQVQDRKTGEFYDPQEKFDELMNRPEIMDVMNERIKELALQAGGYVSLSYEHDGELILSGEDIVEKFAELIVRECMDCTTWVGKFNTNSIEPVHTAHAINQRIKKHFGVEE